MMYYLKYIFLSFLWLLYTSFLFSQNVDTIINKGIYKSYYCYTLKDPLYVVYTLYNGGGDCSRKDMKFVSDSATATNYDYYKSGYDRGHLVNAEDFAFDCENEKKLLAIIIAYRKLIGSTLAFGKNGKIKLETKVNGIT